MQLEPPPPPERGGLFFGSRAGGLGFSRVTNGNATRAVRDRGANAHSKMGAQLFRDGGLTLVPPVGGRAVYRMFRVLRVLVLKRRRQTGGMGDDAAMSSRGKGRELSAGAKAPDTLQRYMKTAQRQSTFAHSPSTWRMPRSSQSTHGMAVAERQGFEPWVDVNPQRFSKPSRSTTPAPLRTWGRGASLVKRRSRRKRGKGFSRAATGPLCQGVAVCSRTESVLCGGRGRMTD